MILEVGAKFPVSINAEGCYFSHDDDGYMLILGFDRPTENEIKDVSQNSPFEIRETVIDGVIWITTKMGSMPWMDCPYTPHLDTVKAFPEKDIPNALTVVLVDIRSGIIKHMRLVGLGNRFAETLKRDCVDLLSRPFMQGVYDESIGRTMARCSSKQLADMSRNYFKLK